MRRMVALLVLLLGCSPPAAPVRDVVRTSVPVPPAEWSPVLSSSYLFPGMLVQFSLPWDLCRGKMEFSTSDPDVAVIEGDTRADSCMSQLGGDPLLVSVRLKGAGTVTLTADNGLGTRGSVTLSVNPIPTEAAPMSVDAFRLFDDRADSASGYSTLAPLLRVTANQDLEVVALRLSGPRSNSCLWSMSRFVPAASGPTELFGPTELRLVGPFSPAQLPAGTLTAQLIARNPRTGSFGIVSSSVTVDAGTVVTSAPAVPAWGGALFGC